MSVSSLVASAAPVAGDVNFTGDVDASDVQLVINAALEISVPGWTDLNFDSSTDAIDVQLVVNAVLGIAVDSDGDGLFDVVELGLGTRSDLEDTDSDGVGDGQEMLDGSDPLVDDREPGEVVVPNVEGLVQSAAETILADAGLEAVVAGTAVSETVPAGSIISQNPAGGTQVSAGSSVSLVVSTGSGGGSGLPPDPQDVASPVDPTVPTDIFSATEFLYTGVPPIQTGVSTASMDPQRAVVLRGRVISTDGSAMPEVTVTVLDHPEFGQTLTREDGMFDMAVNGGGRLTVNYAKEGYLTAQRQVDTPWRDYRWLPDVALVELDSAATEIDFTEPIEVARGTLVEDADGVRQSTLLFAQGTSAEMVFADGSTEPLATLTVRTTEYSVGEHGKEAMPAELPPTSGYTYCVEMTADEALDAGAADVQFDQPVINYVENFVGFPVGSAVPTGYYDRTRAEWIPSDNGRVIAIVGESGGMADVDIDGDETADDGPALAELGITEAERAQLAQLYDTGTQLWRVPVTHFTPWDHNWPYGPPGGAGGGGGMGGGRRSRGEDDPCEDERCVIELQGQVLGELIPLAGSPFTLNYRSDRVPGRTVAYEADIIISEDTIPDPLKRIDLEVLVAGQRFQQSFPAETNQRYLFVWDGRDAYGRTLQGEQLARVRIGYVYDAVYLSPAEMAASFARFSGSGVVVQEARRQMEIKLWREWDVSLGVWDARFQGMGGWTLSEHHNYNPDSRTIYLGDGRRRSGEALTSVVKTIASGGTIHLDEDFAGGIPATEANIYPYHVAADPEGGVYIATLSRIFHVDSSGIIRRVAGQKWPAGFEGDGGPAIDAVFDGVAAIDLAADGSLYIADGRNARVRRIGPDGIITTVAGTGTPGNSGDGGPATDAEIYSPNGVAAAPDGGFYFSQGTYPRVRYVGPDGIITTVAGGEAPWGTLNEGGLATEAHVQPDDVALGPDGSIYIVHENLIRRVTQDGIITTVAGGGPPGTLGDGGPATEATFYFNVGGASIDIGPDGSIYIPDSRNNRVRRIGPDSIINTIAGNGETEHLDVGEGEPATGTEVNDPRGVSIGPDGRVYVACYRRVRAIEPASPNVSVGDLLIPSRNGSEIFVFSEFGKHRRTLDGYTGSVRYEFGYDTAGFLTSVTDGDGNITTLERDNDGNLTSITSPGVHQTDLSIDTDGHLETVVDPSGASWSMTYHEGGLLASYTNPNGVTQLFTYDDRGRLERDDDPAGGYIELTRTELEDGFEVSTVTAEGRPGTYRVRIMPDDTIRRLMTTCTGTQNTMELRPDGTTQVTAANGTVSTIQFAPDPRFGMVAPLIRSYTETTPGGLTLNYSKDRSATFDEEADVLHPLSVETTQNLNGQVSSTVYLAAEQTLTRTTPEGRQVVTVLDDRGRPVEYRFGTLAALYLGYDEQGRLVEIRRGADDHARTYTFAYTTDGFVESVTDPMGRTTGYTLDAVGRIAAVSSQSGAQTFMGYDNVGNLVSLTPPGRPAHGFAYNEVNRLVEYDPPDVGGSTDPLSLVYNLDRQPVLVTRPGGAEIEFGYSACGRLESTTIDRGVIQYEFNAESGHLDRVIAPDGEVTFGYDGGLVTSMSWSGSVAGQVDNTYNNQFQLASRSVNSTDTVGFAYDNDGLLVQAGDLVITRDGETGLITETVLGSVTDIREYDQFGDLAVYACYFGEEPILELSYTRDKLGRIIQMQETQDMVTDTYEYSYDPDGRLAEVTRNGSIVATYTYDQNGNRLDYTDDVGSHRSAVYDDRDRILSFGTATYEHGADGVLNGKTDGSDGTIYEYDELGSLVSVTLPDGALIEYLIDGRNRRIGKQVDGVLVQGFLYKDMLNPVAELDGSGAVVNRFVYGTNPNVPDYMIRGGSTYRIITDHLGSPRFVVDTATGAQVQRMVYDAFGNVLHDSYPGLQPFGFAGGLYDPDTGLVRFGVRDYDPEIGRFTAPDPMLFSGGGANLYAYVSNDPVNRADPSGLRDSDCDEEERDRDCDGRRERYESEARRETWRHSRIETSIPSWLDSVIGLGGAVTGAVVYMEGIATQMSAVSGALGLITWPVAFEGARQTADQLAETLIDERVERDMEQLDEMWREASGTERRDCP